MSTRSPAAGTIIGGNLNSQADVHMTDQASRTAQRLTPPSEMAGHVEGGVAQTEDPSPTKVTFAEVDETAGLKELMTDVQDQFDIERRVAQQVSIGVISSVRSTF